MAFATVRGASNAMIPVVFWGREAIVRRKNVRRHEVRAALSAELLDSREL